MSWQRVSRIKGCRDLILQAGIAMLHLSLFHHEHHLISQNFNSRNNKGIWDLWKHSWIHWMVLAEHKLQFSGECFGTVMYRSKVPYMIVEANATSSHKLCLPITKKTEFPQRATKVKKFTFWYSLIQWKRGNLSQDFAVIFALIQNHISCIFTDLLSFLVFYYRQKVGLGSRMDHKGTILLVIAAVIVAITSADDVHKKVRNATRHGNLFSTHDFEMDENRRKIPGL